MAVPAAHHVVLWLAAAACSLPAPGAGEYEDFAQWQAAVGPFTTIDFTGFPQSTIIFDQYADEGVLFTDHNDRIVLTPDFLQDGSGLYSAIDYTITLQFDSPKQWIACHYPGWVKFALYYDGTLVYVSSDSLDS